MLQQYHAQYSPDSCTGAAVGLGGASASEAASLSCSFRGVVVIARCSVAAMLRFRSVAVAVRPRVERLGLVVASETLGDTVEPS